MRIQDVENEIVEEFAFLSDWEDKYEHLLEHGKRLARLDPAHKVEENRVTGCQSQVWLIAELRGGLVHFDADSDAQITKSLVALLLRVLSDRTPDEILAAELRFIDQIELREHLSPNRRNGLSNMIKKMKAFALAFQSYANRA